MALPFSEQQLQVMDCLEWILNPDTKSDDVIYAVALAALRVAARNPKKWVHVTAGSKATQIRIENAVHALVEGTDIHQSLMIQHNAVRLSLESPVEDWSPPNIAPNSFQVQLQRRRDSNEKNRSWYEHILEEDDSDL